MSQCEGSGYIDEHINLKYDVMGGSCNLRSTSAPSLFLCLVSVHLYRENIDSHI